MSERAIKLAGRGLIVLLALGASACTPPAEPPKPAPVAAAPAAAPAASPAAAPAGKSPAATPPAGEPSGALAPALKELKEKIQPPQSALAPAPAREADPVKAVEAKPAPRADEKELLLAAEGVAKELVEALVKGDLEQASRLTVTAEDMGKVLNPGYKDILEGTILPQTAAALRQLAATLKGKTVTHTFHPGSLTTSLPRSSFIEGAPILSDSRIVVRTEGISVEIALKQMVKAGDRWQVFQLATS